MSRTAAINTLNGQFRASASRNPNYRTISSGQAAQAQKFVTRQAQQGRGSIMIGAGGLYREIARNAGAKYYVSPRGDFARVAQGRRLGPGAASQPSRTLPAGWKTNQKYIVKALLRGNAVGVGTPVQFRNPRGGYNAELKLMRRMHARGLVNAHTARVPTKDGRSRLILTGFTPTAKLTNLRANRQSGGPAPAPRGPQ